MIILLLVLLGIGFALLSKGSDYLVDGASSIAKNFGISPLVIGLTIVSFGTSAPELVVSLASAIEGKGEIAVANVLGSNILNILLILGICALIKPLQVKSSTVWKEIPLALVAPITILFLGFADVFKKLNLNNLSSFNNFDATKISGYLSFSQGIILLIFFVIYMYYNFGLAKNTSDIDINYEDENSPRFTQKKSILLIIGGLVILIIGGQTSVYAAVELAKMFGISDRIIGLTIVALGTSLPELFTSVKATMKGELDIAIGNIVGSNIFNIFFILGISSIFGMMKLTNGEFIDTLVAILAAVILFLSIFVFKKGHIGKLEGFFMLFIYGLYVSYLISGK